jgi:plastocyanin
MWNQLRKSCAVSLAMGLLTIAAMGCTGQSRDITESPARKSSAAPMAAAEPQPHAGAKQVVIDNFTFEPPILTVPAGTKVTWVNHDDVPHTVTSTEKPKQFGSGTLDTDGQFSHVFTNAGNYEYFCAIHPKMTGRIIVK